MTSKSLVIIFIVAALFSCSSDKQKESEFIRLKEELSGQLRVLEAVIPDDKVPRSFPNKDGGCWMVGINDWTCGFPAGSFWLMYEITNNDFWKDAALKNTLKLDGVQNRTNTHDLGFMVFCSYGNAYRLTGNEEYKKVILQASESLITRFNPKIGCIRSWDHNRDKWDYPVIIDNMMNLEMLFWASEVTGNTKFKDVAVSHADITLKNHFREDWSSYHVVSYDTLTGKPVIKQTHQGFNDESAWGRGQAWGLYGYTMCYRKTGTTEYLNAAENIGDYILKNLPGDKISYWDFNDPEIPNTNRDASAAAIMASAFYELSTLSDKGSIYLEVANKIVESLTSENFRAKNGSNGGFLLMHNVGHKPVKSEVDVAINYADYYYLEALKRRHKLN